MAPGTRPRTLGQKFFRELDLYCDREGITMADLCRAAKDDRGEPTARSIVTRWKDGERNPTMTLVERFRTAMKTLTRAA